MKKETSVLVLVAAGLLLNSAVCFAGRAEIKTVKQYAIARCNSADTTVGTISGKGIVMSVQELVDQVYDQAATQLGAAGFKVADSEAVAQAAAAATGKDAADEEKDARNEAAMKKMEEMQKAQAANMPAGMPAGMPDMSSLMGMKKMMGMKKADKAKSDEAYEEDGSGFNNVKREAAKAAGLAELYPDAYNLNRKSKDERAVQFFQALDKSGADGWVTLEPLFTLEKKKLVIKISSVFYGADGKKLWGTGYKYETELKEEEKGKITADSAKAQFQAALPQAVKEWTNELVKK